MRGGEGVQATALLLVDLATSFILAATNRSCLPALVDDAREVLVEETWGIGPWRRPRSLIVAADLPPDTRRRMDDRAAAEGIAIETALRRPIRSYLLSLFGGEGPLQTAFRWPAAKGAPDAWPVLAAEEFAELLSVQVDRIRRAAERRFDERVVTLHEPLGGGRELATVVAALLLDKDEE